MARRARFSARLEVADIFQIPAIELHHLTLIFAEHETGVIASGHPHKAVGNPLPVPGDMGLTVGQLPVAIILKRRLKTVSHEEFLS